MLLRSIVHLCLHFAVPAAVSMLFFRRQFLRSWLILCSTMLVDVDHLLADPLYDAGRCSIGFHPLHQWPAIVLYGVSMMLPKLRLIGIGLLIHMALDGVDCVWMQYDE